MTLYKKLVDAHAAVWVTVLGFTLLLGYLVVVWVLHVCGYTIDMGDDGD